MKGKYLYPVILAILSFFTRFSFLSFPNQVVFDETHYGKYVSGYLTHSYFFDLHPPLAKLMAALAAYIGHFQPTFDFNNIGETFTDPHYIFLRIVPAICGFLLPFVVYYLAQEIGISRIGAFFAGIVVIFENSLLVQSKFLLLDGQLIFFGFTALLFYFRYNKTKKRSHLWLAVLFLGGVISIKWTGISFWAICLATEVFTYIHDKTARRILNCAILVVVPLMIYVALFAIHFQLLTQPGPGDPFMSREFSNKNFSGKFIELNNQMWLQNKNLAASHPYASRWYTWPLMIRPIYYWERGDQKIYSTGNPFVYWLSAAAILILLGHLIFRTKFFKMRRHAIILILAGYAINFFPFMFLKRISFIYYYLAALVFAILALSLLIDSIENKKKRMVTMSILLILFLATFFYFAPFTYGFPISPTAQQSHFWFKSWE